MLRLRFSLPGRLTGIATASATLLLVVWSVASETPADFQGATHLVAYEEEPINYAKTLADGPVPQLLRQIESGEVQLHFDSQSGYLPALLDRLKISKSSQVLVFSKTSMQRERISPKTPRAIFFNDDVYVGFIPGSPLLEISSVDPKLGAIFYTLEQKPADRPRPTRTDACLECHASAKSMGVPGHLLRSFAVDQDGAVDLLDGISLVNHRTPIAERWGGWYVTGRKDAETHRGNLFGEEAFARHEKEAVFRGTLPHLGGLFDPNRYPASSSDIVALMVLEHQTHLHNFITRLHYESAIHLQAYGHVNYLKNIVTAFLKYLLFVDEAPLAGPIEGGAEFLQHFENLGPRDKAGRSLRQFDLKTRLFKFPCSFLICSEAFDGLPSKMKEVVYRRLWEILVGRDLNKEFQDLSEADRGAIRAILADTKPDLPDYWKDAPPSGAVRASGAE